MNNIHIEYAILSGMMDPLCEDINAVRNIHIDEKYFTNSFTKLIARIINKLYAKHEYADSLAVESFARRDAHFHDAMFTDLLMQTPIPASGIKFYLKWLKHNYVAKRIAA